MERKERNMTLEEMEARLAVLEEKVKNLEDI